MTIIEMIKNLAQRSSVVDSADVLAVFRELEAKDKRIAELEQVPTIKHMRSVEEALICATDRVSELEAKLATPVRLTEERTLWAGEDDYDTGHVKGWNANRIEQAALLKKQGFRVEGNE